MFDPVVVMVNVKIEVVAPTALLLLLLLILSIRAEHARALIHLLIVQLLGRCGRLLLHETESKSVFCKCRKKGMYLFISLLVVGLDRKPCCCCWCCCW